jgi:hypothetical protein
VRSTSLARHDAKLEKKLQDDIGRYQLEQEQTQRR